MFREIRTREKNLTLRQVEQKKAPEIKPETKIEFEEAKNFWAEMFNKEN